MTPKILKNSTNNILKELGCEVETITITEKLETVRTVDLSLMSRDPLRTTFSFISRFYAGMFQDEINYILGIEPQTTVADHYIDFGSEEAQEQLRKGLNKIESILEKRKIKVNE